MKKASVLLFGLFCLLVFNIKAEAAATEVDATDNLPTSAFTASSVWKLAGDPGDYGPYKAFDNVWNENNGGFQSGRDQKPPQWVQVDLGQSKSITKMQYQADISSNFAYDMKDFTVKASNDGTVWTQVYAGTALGNNNLQEFPIQSTDSFRYWRITVSSTIGGKDVVNIGEVALLTSVPDPTPTTPTTPTTEDRAIFVVTMTNGLEKEFDLSMEEVNNFINWYETKQAGSGKASYAIDKHSNNKGSFKSRKDYVLFDRILTFEVNQY